MNESINAESLETLNNFNIQYETEKKEKQNLQLQADLTQSQLAEAEQKNLRNQIITVADSGVGMKKSQLSYIFDRFYQADSSENQPKSGTSIGLSLVKELVELHGGTIQVESELNQGISFIIAIPLPENLEAYALEKAKIQLSPEALPTKTVAKGQDLAAEVTKLPIKTKSTLAKKVFQPINDPG